VVHPQQWVRNETIDSLVLSKRVSDSALADLPPSEKVFGTAELIEAVLLESCWIITRQWLVM
jgi:hypothetical protein